MASRFLRANVKSLKESELKLAIDSLAKVANQRLRELEKSRQEGTKSVQYSQHSSAYAYVEKLAYDKENIRKGDENKRAFITTNKAGAPIFKRGTKGMTEEVMRRELETLQKFLASKTSTVSGTKAVLKKGFEEFKKQDERLSKLSEEQYRGFWNDLLIQNAMSLFYSSMSDLFSEASKQKLSAEEFANILEDIGITKDMTPSELEAEGISYKDILDSIKKWKLSGIDATEGKSIKLDEGL